MNIKYIGCRHHYSRVIDECLINMGLSKLFKVQCAECGHTKWLTLEEYGNEILDWK